MGQILAPDQGYRPGITSPKDHQNNMLEHFLDTFYPLLEERAPLPALYLPATLATLILGYTIGPGQIQTPAVTALLLLLALQRPRYTAGSVTLDYSLSGFAVFFILSFLEYLAQ
ncbi:hypothetical protein GGR53DRAFT_467136 [Hypoxylon sp. FL1150]|nr:hypothetical protein GGR53DRAFT_467136 [Hypoxylon sp. FL1150]